MKRIFIINPIAGKSQKSILMWYLKRHGENVICTEYPGHGEKIARETDADIVVAVGGDGTVNEVARGLIGTKKVLGIIPCGSGDGLALHLGISRYHKKAYETILQGKTHPLDAAQINGRAFFSVCGVGFDAIVSERYAKSGKRGLASYMEQGLKTWMEFKPEKYTINIDGKEWESEAALITVGNSSQWGNGAKITPLADSSDGILDITVADMFKTIELPALGLLLMTGKIDMSQEVHCYKGKHITISRQVTGPAHADGEWFEAGKQISIDIIPHALTVLVP